MDQEEEVVVEKEEVWWRWWWWRRMCGGSSGWYWWRWSSSSLWSSWRWQSNSKYNYHHNQHYHLQQATLTWATDTTTAPCALLQTLPCIVYFHSSPHQLGSVTSLACVCSFRKLFFVKFTSLRCEDLSTMFSYSCLSVPGLSELAHSQVRWYLEFFCDLSQKSSIFAQRNCSWVWPNNRVSSRVKLEPECRTLPFAE